MKKLRFILCLVCSLVVLRLAADEVKDLQREQEQIRRELAETEQLLKETKKNETATTNKLTLLNKNIKDRKRLINGINREIQAIDHDMLRLVARRGELQVEQNRLREDYAQLIRKTHYQQRMQSPLLFILSAKNFQQLMRRMRYLRQFARYRQRQVAAIEATQADIDAQNQSLAERKTERNAALKSQQKEQEQLTRDQRKQQKMLNELKKKEKNLAAKQKKQQKRINEINKKIEDVIRKQATKTTLTKEQQLLAGGFEQNKGRLPWPVEKGFISGTFGVHQHPVYEHVTVNNKGIYLQTTAGSTARAVYEGEVSSCVVLGNTYAVIVQHGNYRTVYSNLSQLKVKQGDKVKAKQALGTIYSDPDDDNKTEVYFQIYKDRQLLDPTPWLAR
ncbi:MAG: peptidoglycan DD-metalloendopeptidase family protein [Paludibacteraceae bacterium]|nr:peptidoglycan DD-metalloendopeptidase family protein [Paludibacteraceae bacterium]